ncbi:hypothetical protein ABLV96_04745 [Staphylococcus equorum]
MDESTLITIAVTLVTMWKDNPFTDAAKGSFLNLILISLKYFDYNVVKKGH